MINMMTMTMVVNKPVRRSKTSSQQDQGHLSCHCALSSPHGPVHHHIHVIDAEVDWCSFNCTRTSCKPRMDWKSSPSGLSPPTLETVSAGLFTGFEESSSGRVMSRGATGQLVETDPPLSCSSTCSTPAPPLLPADQVCPTSPLP